eukprot:2121771-Ditylum_brightwellii.AAC.1
MVTTDTYKKNILGLLDTGAIGKIGNFIKCGALVSILRNVEHIDCRIQGQYATETVKEVATFEIKLPELCWSKMFKISAYIEDN